MTTVPQTASPAEAQRSVAKRAGQAIGLAASIGVAANLAVYGVARLVDVDLLIPESPGSEVLTRLELAPVVIFSIVPVVLAAAVAVALGRWVATRGRQIFTILVTVGLAASFAPIVTGGLTGGTVVALSMMHLVVAAAALAFLPRLASRA